MLSVLDQLNTEYSDYSDECFVIRFFEHGKRQAIRDALRELSALEEGCVREIPKEVWQENDR